MSLSRREFTRLLALGGMAGLLPGAARAATQAGEGEALYQGCLLYTSPSPRD